MQERRAPKNIMMRKEFNDIIGKSNVIRCRAGAFALGVFAGVSMILMGTLYLTETNISFIVPGAVFSFICAIFGIIFQIIDQNEAREYYTVVPYIFVTFMIIYGTFLSVITTECFDSICLYYLAVIFCAYTVVVNTPAYIAIMIAEAAELVIVAIIAYNIGKPLSYMQYIFVLVTHIFSYVLAKESREMRTELARQELIAKKEVRQAERDPLTGLINRRGLERATKKIFKSCQENGSLIGMMILDIDHFKKYNDGYGHVQGDRCLQMVAKCIADTVGNRGFTSRIGGEEFLIFVYGMDAPSILGIGEEVRSSVEAMGIPHATGKGDVVTVSIGVYLTELNEQSTFTAVYNKADKYLYKAKQDGRNRVECNRKLRIAKRSADAN
ncbi:MAG: GGDEF domain-containing protein [Lachnospiraceae bacterium]|nr:GGDEF domain-containing protein [Lachnospiraceae bacterium]